MKPRIAVTGIKKDSLISDIEDFKKRGFKILASENYDSKEASVMLSLEPNLFYKLVLGDNLEVRNQSSYSYEVKNTKLLTWKSHAFI